jgi:hypothetical protein
MAAGTSVTFEPKNVQELAHFFETNRDNYHEIWIVISKKNHVDSQPVTFYEAVTEAIKQGLTDSRTKSLNEHKYQIRFTKKKKPKGLK